MILKQNFHGQNDFDLALATEPKNKGYKDKIAKSGIARDTQSDQNISVMSVLNNINYFGKDHSTK